MKRKTPLPFSSRPELLETYALILEEFAPQLLDNPALLDRLPALFSLIVHSEP